MGPRSKVATVFGAAAAITVLAGAAAFACTNLATLNLSSSAGKPGDIVTVTGSSFRVNSSDVAGSDPVILRWDGVAGAVVAETKPDKAGNLSTTFTVPEGQPGYHVLVASQKDASGADAYGTPARASYLILGVNGGLLQPVGDSPGTGSGTGSPGIVALTLGLGALGVVLFGAGFVAFARHLRRTPAAAVVRGD